MHTPRQHNNNEQNIGRHNGAPKDMVSYEVALREKKEAAKGTFAFMFEKPKGFTFKAGQHVRMTLIDPPETDDEGDSRFLTLASTPSESNLIFVIRMRNTAFKRTLGTLDVGKKVLIQMLLKSPHGSFALHEDISKPAVFLVGGIGVVPAYSMIKDAIERNLSHKIFLFFSNRRPEDAPFLKELSILANSNPNFQLIATMTDTNTSSSVWHGEIGRIDESLIKKYVDNIQAPIYYLAGLPEMVSAVKNKLFQAGVSEDSIHAEEFTGFNLNEININTSRPKNTHAAIAVTVIAIMTLVGVHAILLKPLFTHNSSIFTLNNPLLYLGVALVSILIMLKIKLFSRGFTHGTKKKTNVNRNKI